MKVAIKPHITRVIRFNGYPLWVIHFPPYRDDSVGVMWIAGDCAYVRKSIAAWYDDGPLGLERVL